MRGVSFPCRSIQRTLRHHRIIRRRHVGDDSRSLLLRRRRPTIEVTPGLLRSMTTLDIARPQYGDTLSRRCFSVETPSRNGITNDAEGLKWDELSRDEFSERIRDACREGRMKEAGVLLSRAEEVYSEQSTFFFPDLEAYTCVLDGWLDYQAMLDQQEQSGGTTLKKMAAVAEEAETVLHRMIQNSQHLAEESNDTGGVHHLRPTGHHYSVVIQAFARVARAMQREGIFLKGIPQRAQHALEMMEEEYLRDPLSETKPPALENYHRVMEAWGNSLENMRGTRAMKIFDKISEKESTDAETHRIMMRVWIQSGEKWAAHRATWHLTVLVMNLRNGEKEMEPTMEDYHLVLEAWSKASDKKKVGKARTVFRHIEEGHSFRRSDVQPDETCFRFLLETLASSTGWGNGPIVDLLLNQMRERQIIPDSRCYSAAIRTWNHQVRHKKCEKHHEDAMRAFHLLIEMERAHHRSARLDIKPKTADYNAVLQALSFSAERGAAERADALLSKMEKAAIFNDDDVVPNSDSFIFALYAWSKSGSEEMVERAAGILERIKDKDKLCHPALKPNDRVLTAFITVCGRVPNDMDAEEKRHVWQLAVGMTEEMRAIGAGPNSVAYTWLITTCRKLLPPGDERERALANVFKSCCDNGMVDGRVLRLFRTVASEEMYRQMVVDATSDAVNGNYVPSEWTRNVGVSAAHTPLPLTLEHGFDFTPAFDKKMTKLRQKKNQRLLRGGRLKSTRRQETYY